MHGTASARVRSPRRRRPARRPASRRPTPPRAASRSAAEPELARIRAPVDVLEPLDLVDIRAGLRELHAFAFGAPGVDVLLAGVVRRECKALVSVLLEQMVEIPGAVADVDLRVVQIARH